MKRNRLKIVDEANRNLEVQFLKSKGFLKENEQDSMIKDFEMDLTEFEESQKNNPMVLNQLIELYTNHATKLKFMVKKANTNNPGDDLDINKFSL